jgi:UDP-N-acetylmuramoylalanine--D-glutamate ligase
MITSSAFAGKRYAVYGLARSGVATVDALLASGAEVMAWDVNEAARAAVADRARIADPLSTAIYGYSAVVVSPGVPINKHPIADRARAAGVPLIGDIELFALARAELPPHQVVGITGTNGKSTTTALVHHLLQTAGAPSAMGGNIGLPILGQQPLPAGGIYLLELSSYQIDLTQSLDCDISVLLNVAPDHLDRYDGIDDYAASKARLFAMQSPDHLAVIAVDDEFTRAIAGQVEGLKVLVQSSDVKDQSRWPALQGPHNGQNVAAAVAVARSLGVPDELISAGLASYPGLPHRMERVTERNGVLFVNDSKATNPASTAPALAAFPPNPEPRLHWILGGIAKSDDLEACDPFIGNVRAAYTIGQDGPRFADLLRPRLPVRECGELGTAVDVAAHAARSGEVVLLSPAAASFDQFTDFESRGAAFRAAVEALA